MERERDVSDVLVARTDKCEVLDHLQDATI